jgi:hypothetical protein
MFQFPAVRATRYVLRFETPGFAPAERTVTLLVGQTPSIEIALQLASVGTTVAVETEIADVETTSSTVAGNVSPTEVSKLPLNGRNYLQLATLVPGITSNDVTNSPLGATDGGKIQINIDGQQVTQNSAADSFNASDSVAHRVMPFSDQQFGGTVGGPILKKVFFFGCEGERAGLFYADIQANQTIDAKIFDGQTTLSPAIRATAGNPISSTQPFGSVTGAQFLSGAVNAQTIQPLGRQLGDCSLYLAAGAW